MTQFENAHSIISDLVNKFNSNLNYYTSTKYQEAEARKDYIDKFFIALGWDVNHDHQHNPYEQEVKVEKGQKETDAVSQKRADYAFYTAPNFKDVLFFVEAKKPSVGLRNETHYFQTVRYGWNAQTPLAILTDFEEFHILDCRFKPDIKNIFSGQHKEYRFTEYLDKEKFAEIYYQFSREAVSNNSLEKHALTLAKPKGKAIQKTLFKGGYQAIDDSFLEYIDAIRENIAKAFKRNNNELDSEQLTEAVQKTVDRLVFIRFLEDKLIETENHVSEWRSWKDFVLDCRKLDAKYNGVVFKKHFTDQPHFAGADERLFLDICADMSNLNSPYDFNYIPIHILGSIYERFLGKVVRAADKRVFIEEKPEVRKAGGVFYTPKYIVDYIVTNTIGELIKNKTPKEITELHFADIACGSGSFLIGVYDYLLEYHKKYFTKKYTKKTEIDKRNDDFGLADYRDGMWQLSLKLKQDILINNIYGVDVDHQATEVTQLSLFLKMLEDETVTSTKAKQGALFSKVLPDLSKNIVCGNSLIGFDIMQGQMFEDDELKKLNPMDYESSFTKIINLGGFDAIVGNPPYVTEIFSDKEVKYFNAEYRETILGKPNLYRIFVHKGINLLAQAGRLGYIIPNTYLTSRDSAKFRNFLLRKTQIEEILFFPESLKVFKGVTQATTILLITKREESTQKPFKAFFPITNVNNLYENSSEEFLQSAFGEVEGNQFVLSRKKKQFDLITKILKKSKKIEDYYSVFQGEINVSTHKNKIFQIQKNTSCYPLIRGNNIGRLVIDVNFNDPKGSWIDTSKGNFREHYQESRVVTQEVSNMQQLRRLNGMPIKRNVFVGHTANYLFPRHEEVTNELVVGLLNSFLLDFIFQTFNSTNHIPAGEIKKLPIPEININNKSIVDKIELLVTQLLECKKQIEGSITDKGSQFLFNKCTSLERLLNHQVYSLYELSQEDINIVEQH